ncbi:uncharacterized protein LOC129581697 [Paramacrobiotus metropolitanus]|uniref:uncharacterized protein LOC129581697 n=1 Tax=Paramacrobiotus metropolitanus TaxID=2943436 RepID=UPI002445FE5A|nr:uncharacterized protein LOC129581697 [Paramacrobiotus metropolitanus]
MADHRSQLRRIVRPILLWCNVFFVWSTYGVLLRADAEPDLRFRPFAKPMELMADEHEYRLMSYLLDNYNKAVRPAKNHTEPLTVTFGVALTQLIDVDEKNQIMTTNCWLNQVWLDNNLRWNPASFGNITTIRIPSEKIWKPDLLLYNNADSDYYHKVISTNAIVQYDGNVTWLASTIFRSSCEIDVQYFPFDQQNCSMKFASWTYDGYKVDLVITTEVGDLSNYVHSCEWDLINMTAKRNVVKYSCCPEPYPDITITLIILRKPLFYVFNYLMPCALITVLAFLGFYTPSESGEKVTLGITTLLSMTVFLMMVGESMPPTSKSLPLIAVYYGITIFLVALATAVQVVTLNMHHRGTRGQKVPHYLKVVVLGYMAPCLRIHIEGTSRQYRVRPPKPPHPDRGGYIRPATHLSMENINQNDTGTAGKLVMQNGIIRAGTSSSARDYSSAAQEQFQFDTQENFNHPFLDTFERQFLRVLNKVYQTIERNEMRLSEQDYKDSLCLEWQEVALVLDRFLLLVFFVATLFFSGIIIFDAPHALRRKRILYEIMKGSIAEISAIATFLYLLQDVTMLFPPPISKSFELDQQFQEMELRITDYILKDYNADIMPSKHHTDVLTVTLGLALINLINLDERNQVLTTNCWLNQVWFDHKLAWNPASFGNVTSILIPANRIWRPDVFLYNTADATYYHRAISTNAIIQHTGNVTWFVAHIYRSTCAIDMRRFPFDRQICTMKFGSWTYSGDKIDLALTTTAGDLSSYVPSSEWELNNMSANKSIGPHSCCGKSQPFITVTISMRRLPLFYLFMYLMPCLCVTLFSTVGFFLPVECGEKIFLGIKSLLSLILFVMTISETMPSSFASVPLITMCYGASMLFIGSSMAVQVWTLNLHYRGSRGQKLPTHLRKIFLQWIAPLLFMTHPATVIGQCCQKLSGDRRANAGIFRTHCPPHGNVYEPVRDRKLRLKETSFGSSNSKPKQHSAGTSNKTHHYGLKLDMFQNRILSTLGALCDMIEKSERRVNVQTTLDDVAHEWQEVAVVLDRLSLVVVLIILVTVLVLLSSTYAYD